MGEAELLTSIESLVLLCSYCINCGPSVWGQYGCVCGAELTLACRTGGRGLTLIFSTGASVLSALENGVGSSGGHVDDLWGKKQLAVGWWDLFLGH